jgi:hypothetical protein
MATEKDRPVIELSSDFEFGAVDGIRHATAAHIIALAGPAAAGVGAVAMPTSDLGPLAPMAGSWSGSGFNTIFRPLNPASPNTLPVPATGDNILELNLTREHTMFSAIGGAIPNRGMVQADIALFGMTYLQQITDVTTQPNVGIHIEPGIWIVVPATTDPGEGPTVARMASIPHGTTVNAQGTTKSIGGPPVIPSVDITPNFIGGAKNPFPSQTATNLGTARIPQDLTSFIAAGTITQAMLDDPNSVLRHAIAGQNIVHTTEIDISTAGLPVSPDSGGTDNIAFLVNGGEAQDTIGNAKSPNANSAKMTATFWIETVERKIWIPIFHPGTPPIRVPIEPALPGHPSRSILIDPVREVTVPRIITLRFLQLQYTQTVFLNFNGLSWPHVSVATLTPSSAIPVPPTAWT